jgi:hypothetical protein
VQAVIFTVQNSCRTTKKTTLADAEITTVKNTGRRAFLGAMGVAGVSAALVPVDASAQQITDEDSGAWTGGLTDSGGCGRGQGGVETGTTDADISPGQDLAGHGRGTPYC